MSVEERAEALERLVAEHIAAWAVMSVEVLALATEEHMAVLMAMPEEERMTALTAMPVEERAMSLKATHGFGKQPHRPR